MENILGLDENLFIGEVSEVRGRKVLINLKTETNPPYILHRGEILKNISVNNFIVIHKGFSAVVVRIEGELSINDPNRKSVNRQLETSIIGNIDEKMVFTSGIDEIPQIGNGAYLSNQKIIALILEEPESILKVEIGSNKYTGTPFNIEIDKIFNSHIAIFGNTGSGKSNTLNLLYTKLFEKLESLPSLNAKYVFFDFNGEYTGEKCLSSQKKCYTLSTRKRIDRIPISFENFLDIDLISILSQATEKTQKPFLKRAIKTFNKFKVDFDANIKDNLKKLIKSTFRLSDRAKFDQILPYIEGIVDPGQDKTLDSDYVFHGVKETFVLVESGNPKNHLAYFNGSPSDIEKLDIYKEVESISISTNLLDTFLMVLLVQIITDLVYTNHQDEHIGPVIKKLKSKIDDISKIINFSKDFEWESQILVVNLHDVNTEMKKILPLIISKMLYDKHKVATRKEDAILNIIIDEAHNILSEDSTRETKEWRDHRLETFEEIIKEGRKFGVFLTISSQRPSDISPTITSQAHNFFIHRLINNRDLEMISRAVSYIDRISEESIPTLPSGQCIFSGISANFPTKLKIHLLDEEYRPKSKTPTYKGLLEIEKKKSQGIKKKKKGIRK